MANEKRKTYTSSEVKNRYNEKAYDRISLMVYKGEKETIKKRAESLGMSVNAYINMLIEKDICKKTSETEEKAED